MSNRQYAKQIQELTRALSSVVDTLIFDQFKKESERKISRYQIVEAMKYLKVVFDILGEDINL